MLNRHNRLLVTFYVLSDAFLGTVAFLAAYLLRFHSAIATLIPITKGVPPLRQYIDLVPFVAVLVPIGFHLQGLYRLRRGRSRVDDFFAVFVGSILAVVFGIMATTYVEIYFATPASRDRGAFEVSQAAWVIFLVLNVLLTFATREAVRTSWAIRSSASSTTAPPAIISATAGFLCSARSTMPRKSPLAKACITCTSRCRPSSTCACCS